MSSTNPFINRSVPPDVTPNADNTDEHSEEGVSIAHGPASPLAQSIAHETTETIPKRAADGEALVHVAGVHGGAGATTLCTLLKGDAVDTHGAWPQSNPWAPAAAGGTLLVARTHGRGLDALHNTLTAWHHGAYADAFPLLGICIIDDAPRLTKGQVARMKTLMGMAPHSWHMPWVESYRVETHELSTSLGTRRLLNSIRRHAHRLQTKGTRS